LSVLYPLLGSLITFDFSARLDVPDSKGTPELWPFEASSYRKVRKREIATIPEVFLQNPASLSRQFTTRKSKNALI